MHGKVNFARYNATLRRHHPDAAQYVFHNLSAATGSAAVHGVATFLARIEALEKGTSPMEAPSPPLPAAARRRSQN